MFAGVLTLTPFRAMTRRTSAVTVESFHQSQTVRSSLGEIGGIDEHISAHCRVRAVVELRAELSGRAGWVGGVAVPAPTRLSERVRGAAGPVGRPVPIRPQQRPGPAASPVCPGD